MTYLIMIKWKDLFIWYVQQNMGRIKFSKINTMLQDLTSLASLASIAEGTFLKGFSILDSVLLVESLPSFSLLID